MDHSVWKVASPGKCFNGRICCIGLVQPGFQCFSRPIIFLATTRKHHAKPNNSYNSFSKFSHDSTYDQRSAPYNDPVFSFANWIADRNTRSARNHEIPVSEKTMNP
jgi:hypothetical protein